MGENFNYKFTRDSMVFTKVKPSLNRKVKVNPSLTQEVKVNPSLTQHVKLVIYNRVPKCGSSTMKMFLSLLSTLTKQYVYYKSTIYSRFFTTSFKEEVR